MLSPTDLVPLIDVMDGGHGGRPPERGLPERLGAR